MTTRAGVRYRVLLVLGAIACLLLWTSARADVPAGSASVAAAPCGAPSVAAPPASEPRPQDVSATQVLEQDVRALLRGELSIEVDPQTLFDVPLSDSRAVAVEVARLRKVVEAVGDAGAPAALAGADAGAAGMVAPPADLWVAQLALDRARLDFLSQPAAKRTQQLEAHAARVAAAADQGASNAGVTNAQAVARDAERERQAMLAAAARAHSEAIRLLKEEQARLLALKVAQAEYEGELAAREAALAERSETTLGWRRKVTSHLEAFQRGKATAAESDTLYEELRKALRSSRGELKTALAEIVGAESKVPLPGPDKLQLGVVELDRRAYDELRAELLQRAQALTNKEADVESLEAKALVDQVQSLNRDRLALYSALTDEYRERLMGFGAVGIDQGRGELEQVSVVLRYQVVATIAWLDKLRREGTVGLRGFVATLTVAQLLILGVVFGWWRRRGARLIDAISEASRGASTGYERPSSRLLPVVRRVRQPVEWWLFLWGAKSLVGPDVAEILEARIFWLFASWMLGGIAAVQLIDAVAASRRSVVSSKVDVDALRLASLRFVGRIVVVFGLVLSLSTELVGRGTLRDWTLFAIWLSVAPVAVILISRWRHVIFERVIPRKNRNVILSWTAARQAGWQSYGAAAVGGAYLLGLGVYRLVRDTLVEFTLVRRALAYLFRRELSRHAEDMELAPLTADEAAAFDPDRPVLEPMIAPLEGTIRAIGDVVRRPDGGVIAVVGERGSGKTTLVHVASADLGDILHVAVGFDGYRGVRKQLSDALGLPETVGEDELLDQLSKKAGIIAVDAAHRLIRCRVGGFTELDRLLDLARRASRANSWMIVFDDSVFDLVERARGLHPGFDLVVRVRPWNESELRRLVMTRAEAAGLDVRFEHLVRDHVQGDEIDRAERLQRATEGYFRLLWDISAGNPAVALDMWQRALGRDDAGVVRAGLIHAFSTTELERLPDSAAFVLRALVRLEPASEAQIAQMTHTPRADVEALVQHGTHRGYLEYVGEKLRVRWEWFRPIRRVLERRHLLTAAR